MARLDRLLYALASHAGTGAISIEFAVAHGAAETRHARVELDRGFVYAIAFDQGAGAHPRAEENLRRLLKHKDARSRFEPGAEPLRAGRVTPFQPAGVLRNHFEAELPATAGPSLRARAGREKLRLIHPPHPSCLGADERRLIALLAVPRSLAELDDFRVAPPPRSERLLAFLEAAAALTVGPSVYHLLGVAEGAPLDEVRRAYKRVARDLHPDLHPDAPEPDRRRMESRLGALTAAWRALLDSE